ncbi:MAG: T9SS type A sorting domain-containing protein [Bacteroidia bacterium]|nr:T9SS type A sorting domain-containing protein [Bacteroidia bacterium]
MKNILLSISLVLITSTSYGQTLGGNYFLNFEDEIHLQCLRIDTIRYQNNLWQVGAPQKTIFTGASSPTRAIVTDTIHSYAINDTSVFIITNVAGFGFEVPHTVLLSAKYYVNSDTLSDYGAIEFSPDNGNSWIDLINDTMYASLIWWNGTKPTLTGNSNGWKYFYANMATLGPVFNIHHGDTVLYRFSFISDSIQTNKDGLMFDDFRFEDWAEDIEEIQKQNGITIYPNPASRVLKIHILNAPSKAKVQIINYTGQLLMDDFHFTGESIDVSALPNGIYFLRYIENENSYIKKIVVQKD